MLARHFRGENGYESLARRRLAIRTPKSVCKTCFLSQEGLEETSSHCEACEKTALRNMGS